MLLKHAKPARRLQMSGRGPAQLQSGASHRKADSMEAVSRTSQMRRPVKSISSCSSWTSGRRFDRRCPNIS